MAPTSTAKVPGEGTRFRLFPQAHFLPGFEEPETVEVSSPAGSVKAGPRDQHMYVVEPLGKPEPYGIRRGPHGTPYLYLPPWTGESLLAAQPTPDGHFDHLKPEDPTFESADVFGTVRFVLDVWEGYFGRPIEWHFKHDYKRLEILFLRDWDNAQMGYGFLEMGGHYDKAGAFQSFGLNFDVIAHELGHAIIYISWRARPGNRGGRVLRLPRVGGRPGRPRYRAALRQRGRRPVGMHRRQPL